MKRIIVVVFALLLTVSCAVKNKPSTPVPGQVDAFDAYAFRIIADAQAAIHSIKTWQVCTVQNFPTTVSLDNTVEVCDPSNGKFKDEWKIYLNTAITSYNKAQAAGKAYHAGMSGDQAALQQALNDLNSNVSVMLTKTGGK